MPEKKARPALGDLRIKNLKVFKDIEIKPLKLINIIGGANGVGKSTLIETIAYLGFQKGGPEALAQIFKRSGAPPLVGKNAAMLFNWGRPTEASSKAVICSSVSGLGQVEVDLALIDPSLAESQQFISPVVNQSPGENISLLAPSVVLESTLKVKNQFYSTTQFTTINDRLSFRIPKKERSLPATYPGLAVLKGGLADVDMLAATLSELIKANKISELVEQLRLVIPGISGLYLTEDRSVYVQTSQHMLPLSHFGGAASFLGLASACIIQGENGLFACEHFESEIHYTVLQKVWVTLATLAKKYNCQLFITTHSDESLFKAYNGMAEAELLDEMQYIRLDKMDDGTNRAVVFSQEELRSSLVFNMDVR